MEKVWSGGVESPKKKEVTIFIFMAADGLNTFHFKAFIEFFTQKCYPTFSTALAVLAKEFGGLEPMTLGTKATYVEIYPPVTHCSFNKRA